MDNILCLTCGEEIECPGSRRPKFCPACENPLRKSESVDKPTFFKSEIEPAKPRAAAGTPTLPVPGYVISASIMTLMSVAGLIVLYFNLPKSEKGMSAKSNFPEVLSVKVGDVPIIQKENRDD